MADEGAPATRNPVTSIVFALLVAILPVEAILAAGRVSWLALVLGAAVTWVAFGPVAETGPARALGARFDALPGAVRPLVLLVAALVGIGVIRLIDPARLDGLSFVLGGVAVVVASNVYTLLRGERVGEGG